MTILRKYNEIWSIWGRMVRAPLLSARRKDPGGLPGVLLLFDRKGVFVGKAVAIMLVDLQGPAVVGEFGLAGG